MWDQLGPRFEVFHSFYFISMSYDMHTLSFYSLMQEANSSFEWSFNICIRSSQEPSGPISQKLKMTKWNSRNACLNTANRHNSTGSALVWYICEEIHPVNGCFKFKES